MSTSRRTFIAATATLAVTNSVTNAGASSTVNTYPRLVHHVFFWLKNPGSKEDLARLLEGLRTLSKIESVRGVHFGVPASTEKRDVVDNSYSASEILFFDDLAGQRSTRSCHPQEIRGRLFPPLGTRVSTTPRRPDAGAGGFELDESLHIAQRGRNQNAPCRNPERCSL